MAEGTASQLPAADHDQWYLDVDGQKFGPFTVAQITGLLTQKEITLENRITAPRLGDQWITVAEFMHQNTKCHLIPPRPNEALLAPLHPNGPIRKRDSVDSIFEIIQSMRDRKPQNSFRPESPEDSMLNRALLNRALLNPRLRAAVPAGVLGIIAILGVCSLLSARSASVVSHSEPSAKMETMTQTVAATSVASRPAESRRSHFRPLNGFSFPVKHPVNVARAEQDNRDDQNEQDDHDQARDQDPQQDQALEQDHDQQQNQAQGQDQDQIRERDRTSGRAVAGAFDSNPAQTGDSAATEPQHAQADDTQQTAQFQSNP